MCKKVNICSWLSNNLIEILLVCLLIISVTIIVIEYCFQLNEDISLANIFANIAYSIIAATIFYLIIDVVPTYKKNQIIRNRINRLFTRVKEEIRLCKSVLYPFVLDNSLSRDEYVAEFEKLDLKAKYISENGISIEQYLIRRQGKLELLLNQLLEYNQHLKIDELEVINNILKSVFLMNSIQPIDTDVPEQELYAYPNNQREMGESIFDISELIKRIR